MKRLNFLLLFFLLSFFSIKTAAQSNNANIQIDGNDTDWHSHSFYVDSSAGFEFSVLKTPEKFYLMLRFIDKKSGIKALYSGIQLGFDKEQKNKSQQLINFPLDKSAQVNFAELPRDPMSMEFALLMQSKEYALKRFANGNGVYAVGTQNSNGIDVAIGLNLKDQLIYEVAVPFQALKNKKEDPQAKMNNLQIEVIIPGINLSTTSSPNRGIESAGTEPRNLGGRSFTANVSNSLNSGNRMTGSPKDQDKSKMAGDFTGSIKKKIQLDF